jgi:phosphoesterase RecJ-like protein
MKDRMARVNRLLQTTLAGMVPGLVKDPRVQELIVSVAEVRTTPDLRQARVFVSIFGADAEKERAGLEALNQARGFLRGELGRRVRLRHTPELAFERDISQEHAAHIEEVLRDLKHTSPEPREGSAAVADAIRSGRRFLVTAHPGPDGDAVGCMAAALLVLEGLGKEVVAFNPDPVPRRYRFLEGTGRFVDEVPEGTFDVTLVLDTSDSRMFAGALEFGAPDLGTVVVIDHHKTRGDLGDVVLWDSGAASVGVLLHRVFDELGIELSPAVAEALYCSVISDTGSFRYQNTNPDAMRVAAALLEVGVDPWRVSSNLYEERPRQELELLARVLQTLEVSEDGLAASLTVTPEMLEETGTTPDVVDGFINYARGIQGVEVAILFRPRPDAVRVSFRSRGTVDVAAIAERRGGGGHRNAAGCTVPSVSIDLLRSELFAEVTRTLRAEG